MKPHLIILLPILFGSVGSASAAEDCGLKTSSQERVACAMNALNGIAKPKSSTECATMNVDLDRLACYDAASGRTPKVEAIATPSAGKWQVSKETSALTDDTNVTVALESTESVNCGWNKGGKITLYLRCQEKATSLILSTQCHMTSSEYNDYGDVSYRIDSEKARTANMTESTNNRSLGLWTGGKSIPVIKQMFEKSKMVVRATPFNENPFTVTFDIAGLKDAVKPLQDACKWK